MTPIEEITPGDLIDRAHDLENCIYFEQHFTGAPWVTYYEIILHRALYPILKATGRTSFKYRLAMYLLNPYSKLRDLF